MTEWTIEDVRQDEAERLRARRYGRYLLGRLLDQRAKDEGLARDRHDAPAQ